MFKRFIAIFCCIAVLSFSCILSPATKASRMQIEAEASAGIFAVGVSLAVVVCVVLLWYGISVNTDSTEAQSCVEFVKEKAKQAGISASTLALYAYVYMHEIGEWVAEWVASWDEAYTTTVSSGFVSASARSFLDGAGYTCNASELSSFLQSDSAVIPVYTNPNYTGSYNTGTYIKFFKSSNVDISFLLCSDGFYILHRLGTSYTWDTLNIEYHDYSNSSLTLYNWSLLKGTDIYYSKVFGNVNHWASFFTTNCIPISVSPSTWSDVIGDLDLDNTIPCDVPVSTDKRVVIEGAKDVFDGTDSLDDYQLDNPDVIDFGSALSQLQSSTGNPALTWEDVIGGVNTGEISVSDVLDATDTFPYVLTDSRTGELANSDTPAEFVKPVALTDELSIPDAQTIADSDPYNPKHNKNDDTGKYRLPLFQFFPFCLPYDLYDFLSKLDVEARAPVWEIDTTPLFKHLRFFKADDGYKITIDLSKYDDIFSIIRVFECIGIVVGFVFVSRKLIHGGD